MSTGRDHLLQKVRQAVAEGNRAGPIPSLPERGQTGYQGAGSDPVARFCEGLTAAGGVAHVVVDQEEACARIRELLQQAQAAKVLLGRGAVVDELDLQQRLKDLALEIVSAADLTAENARETFFAADVGITGVDHLIAETGSVVMFGRERQPRSLSLLPPVHIAVAHRRQLLADLFDLFEGPAALDPGQLPANVSVITGPSKTGDIELRLVTGVHGPGKVHVVLITSN